MKKPGPSPRNQVGADPADPSFISVRCAAENGPYLCPCCGQLTLAERGGYDICPVCYWEDDGQDDHDADVVRGGPNAALSLNRARQNYQQFGACDELMLEYVRPPTASEARPPRQSYPKE